MPVVVTAALAGPSLLFAWLHRLRSGRCCCHTGGGLTSDALKDPRVHHWPGQCWQPASFVLKHYRSRNAAILAVTGVYAKVYLGQWQGCKWAVGCSVAATFKV